MVGTDEGVPEALRVYANSHQEVEHELDIYQTLMLGYLASAIVVNLWQPVSRKSSAVASKEKVD